MRDDVVLEGLQQDRPNAADATTTIVDGAAARIDSRAGPNFLELGAQASLE